MKKIVIKTLIGFIVCLILTFIADAFPFMYYIVGGMFMLSASYTIGNLILKWIGR